MRVYRLSAGQSAKSAKGTGADDNATAAHCHFPTSMSARSAFTGPHIRDFSHVLKQPRRVAVPEENRPMQR